MFTIILYFFGLLICIGGVATIIQYIRSKGAFKGEGEKKAKPNAPSNTPPATSPATLDSEEIQHLGEEAAAWCDSWMHNIQANHKWLVVEVSRSYMDCRSVLKDPPFQGYPHCTIQFTKEISWEDAAQVAQQILDIISVRCPKMISVYGLYLDWNTLILPTNGE